LADIDASHGSFATRDRAIISVLGALSSQVELIFVG